MNECSAPCNLSSCLFRLHPAPIFAVFCVDIHNHNANLISHLFFSRLIT